MEDTANQVQALVEISTGIITAYGTFGPDSGDPGLTIVTVPPAEVPKLYEAGIKTMDLATGVITVTPPLPIMPSYADRERDESRTALRFAPDDTTKIAILSDMTIGVVN